MNDKQVFLDVKPIFVFLRNKIPKVKDEIVFMIPITAKEEYHIRECNKKELGIELDNGIIIPFKCVGLFGSTDFIPTKDSDKALKELGIYVLKYKSIKDFETRECIVNDNGYITITEYYGSVSILKVAIAMLGNPERIVVAKTKYDHYVNSKFYIKTIKPMFL
ncbi:hypothetical protein LCGC14_1679360 [marine sediment metagenome]|uniref:Uncharacterized protein n=1 Tax=marine sediment metagenome TaxID=412755 RepID=A0A0F9HP73_9ZZZZ